MLMLLVGCAWVGPEDIDARKDFDGDGYLAVGFGGLDCDDNRADTWPGAAEQCDARDQDCDGLVDEAPAVDGVPWYRDADDDGHGDAANAVGYCADPDEGWSRLDDDCDDTEATAFPGSIEICDGVDNDCDGAADDADADVDLLFYRDADGDGWGTGEAELKADCGPWPGWAARSGDCDDTRPQVNPGEIEVCDGLDNDCEGSVDVGEFTWYLDTDGDGYGSPNQSQQTFDCDVDEGWVGLGGDCDEAQVLINPGRPELCNGVDDDCSGEVDDQPVDGVLFYVDEDGDGYGAMDSGEAACAQPSGSVAEGGDCDDADAAFHPGAAEDCEQDVDFNCDGFVGEVDNDQDGYPACEDCDDGEPTAFPGGEEICDDLNIDEDCDGKADDNDTQIGTFTMSRWYADADGDGYGDTDDWVLACDSPAGRVSDNADCDEGNAAVSPGAREDCGNGIDDDCDGDTDVCDGWSIRTAEGKLDLSSGIGRNVFVLPDLNGDGREEVGLATQFDTPHVYIFAGPMTGDVSLDDALYTYDQAGSFYSPDAVMAAGDVTGDGVPDLVIGESTYSLNGNYEGGVFVLAGPLTSGEYDVTPHALVTETVSIPGGRVGAGVTLGDVDNDTVTDLVVTLGNYYPEFTQADVGALYIYLGPFTGQVEAAEPDASLIGVTHASTFGNTVCVDDLDGDGYRDVVATAPGDGAAYVFLSVTQGQRSADDADDVIETPAGHASYASGACLDFNGDGLVDFASGYGDYTGSGWDGGSTNYGGVWLWTDLTGDPALGDRALFVEGGQNSWLGLDMAVAKDWNTGDGLWVSGPHWVNNSSSEGGMYLLEGPMTGSYNIGDIEKAFVGETNDNVGEYLASGDLDGDGVPDVVAMGGWYIYKNAYVVLGGNL